MRLWGAANSRIPKQYPQINTGEFFSLSSGWDWVIILFFPISFKKTYWSESLLIYQVTNLYLPLCYLFLVLVCHPYQNPRIKVLCLLYGQWFLNNQFMISIFRHWKKLNIEKEGRWFVFFNDKKRSHI